MSDDIEATVEVPPQDMEFRARAKAAGLPDVLISMYGSALRRLVDDEREACAQVCEETTAAWTQHLYNSGCMDCAAAIRARKP